MSKAKWEETDGALGCLFWIIVWVLVFFIATNWDWIMHAGGHIP